MSVARDVAVAVEQDPVLREALARGIVNLRALSRWLSLHAGIDGSEESILSALRRSSSRVEPGPLARAYEALRRSSVRVGTTACAVSLVPGALQQPAVATLLRQLEALPEAGLRFVSSDTGVKLIASADLHAGILSAVPGDLLLDAKPRLTEISIVVPHEHRRVPGILAVVAMRLSAHGINIEEVFDGVLQHIILVHPEDVQLAFEALRFE